MPLDATKRETDLVVDVERAVRCARCNHALTSEKERFGPGLTFMNPSGVIFHVLCFRAVDGAHTAGTPDAETSWFPRTAWVYAMCAQCAGHVGWRYVNLDDGTVFFALIEDCIVDP